MNKKIVVFVGIILILLGVVIAGTWNLLDSPEGEKRTNSSESIQEFGGEEEKSVDVQDDTSAISDLDQTDGVSSEKNVEETPNGGIDVGNIGSFTTGDEDGTATIVVGNDTDLEEQVISFPYKVSGTNLIVQSLQSYDGPFLEDGTDKEKSNVLAAVIKNSGSVPVEYAKILLKSEKQTFTFVASDIPSGASIVVLESDSGNYQKRDYISCTGTIAEINSLDMSKDKINVTVNADQSITVQNLTKKEIPCVRIFYKYYMKNKNLYVGGITYTAKIVSLSAEGEQTIYPSHFASEYSEIVMVRTYDSIE